MIKIAFVCSGISGGGAERFVVTMVNKFSKNKKFETLLITSEKTENEYTLATSVTRKCILKNNYLLDSKAIREYLRAQKIEVAIFIGIYANLCGCLANFFLKTKIIISERNAPKQDNLSRKTKILRRILYRFADYYVFQTEGAKKFYSKKIQRKSRVIPNPVLDDLPMRKHTAEKSVVAIGRLSPQKNYGMLIEAFKIVKKKHPEYVLKIFGRGEEESQLKKQISNLDLNDGVILEGFSNCVHENIICDDIYVMTSDFEGMPNALMEAMAMGFPVISTNCPSGGSADLIENNINGILIPVKAFRLLADKINYLIENESVKERMAQEATKIRNTHNIEKIAKQWEDLILNLACS